MECAIDRYLLRSDGSFKTTVSLLTLYLDDLFTDISGWLKSPTFILLLSTSPFMSVIVALCKCSYIRYVYVNECHIIFSY